jgi:hypothetical protein
VKRDAGPLLVPIVAIALFAFVVVQTIGALEASGAWSGALNRRSSMPVATAEDPFAPIGALLSQPQPRLAATPMRDPFMVGGALMAVATHVSGPRKPAKPAPPARPVLTAIVWDADPRAVVHWQGRDWTVHPGGLFDEFQVVSITRTDVTLSRGRETIVLQRRTQGD